MKISVIVPIYNVQNLLENSLNSLVNQSFHDFEVIMVNDGSTDSSQTIAQKFAKQDNRFRLYTTSNQGLAAARNEGLKYVQGDMVYFMDADDQIAPNLFNEIAVQLGANPELDVIHFSYSEVNHPLMKIKESKLELFECVDGTSALQKLMDVEWQPTAWAYISKRELLEKHNLKFSKGRLFEDENFNAKLLANSKKVGVMTFNSGPYYYLVEKRENKLMYQIMQHKNLIQLNDRLFITNDEYEYLSKNNIIDSEYLNKWYVIKLIWIYNNYFATLHEKYPNEFYKLRNRIINEIDEKKPELNMRQKIQYFKVKNELFYYIMILAKQLVGSFRKKRKKV